MKTTNKPLAACSVHHAWRQTLELELQRKKNQQKDRQQDHVFAATHTSVHEEIEKVKDFLRRPSVFRNPQLYPYQLNL